MKAKLSVALSAACFALMLAMPVQAESRTKSIGIDRGDVAQADEFSSQRRYYRGYYGPRRAYWGPRRYWGPRWGWGPRRYWGPRYAYWGPRRAWWGPRYYWRPRPVFWAPAPAYWGPRPYWGWGGPVISVGFGPRWWW
jgi:hypothetical protein